MLTYLLRRFADHHLQAENARLRAEVADLEHGVARLRGFYRMAIAQRDRALARTGKAE